MFSLLFCFFLYTFETQSKNIQKTQITKKEYSSLRKPGIENLIIDFSREKCNHKLLSSFQLQLYLKTKMKNHNTIFPNSFDFDNPIGKLPTELSEFINIINNNKEDGTYKVSGKLQNDEILDENKKGSIDRIVNETNNSSYSEPKPSSSYSSSFTPSLSQTESSIKKNSFGNYINQKYQVLVYIVLILL